MRLSREAMSELEPVTESRYSLAPPALLFQPHTPLGRFKYLARSSHLSTGCRTDSCRHRHFGTNALPCLHSSAVGLDRYHHRDKGQYRYWLECQLFVRPENRVERSHPGFFEQIQQHPVLQNSRLTTGRIPIERAIPILA